MLTCSECPAQISGPRRTTCSDACRKRRERRLHSEAEARFRAEAADLLRRQTRAVIAGDAEALAAVERDAARLFGAEAA